MHLAIRARALVVFPGGSATPDDLFELLTLRQSQRPGHVPIVLVDEGYWRRIINRDALAEKGMIAPLEVKLLRFAEDGEAAWAALDIAPQR